MSSLDSSLSSATSGGTKFPHIRAFLASLRLEYGTLADKKSPLSKSSSDTSDSEETDNDSVKDGDTQATDAMVSSVIGLIDGEDDFGVKNLLRNTFNIEDEATLENACLELMHKHRDDLSNVPFLFLTPMKRPSRPASRTSFLGSRPGTPTFAPSSPLSQSFRRPSTPLANGVPVAPGSPSSSPVPSAAHAIQPLGSPGEFPGHPSPKFLNAKALEFRPGMSRTLSSSSLSRTTAASPDLWAHNFAPSPTLSSSSLGGGRGSSKLAIAAPLVPDQVYTPSSTNLDLEDDGSLGTKTPPIYIRQDAVGTRRQDSYQDHEDEDEDEDGYSPFIVKPNISPLTRQRLAATLGRSPSETGSNGWSDTSSSPFDVPLPPLSSEDGYYGSYPPSVLAGTDFILNSSTRPSTFSRTDSNGSLSAHPPIGVNESSSAGAAFDVTFAESDMTPFEVLSQIFGASVAPALLQTSLEQNGYDFDSAMAWLVDQALPAPPPGLLQHGPAMMGQSRGVGGGISVAGRDTGYIQGHGRNMGNTSNSRNRPLGHGPNKPNVGSRVCRYFLQGECRRADCRFSHDIDRALCRFWLRGQCAKGENCEFLHSLPQHIDFSGLNSAMHRFDFDDRDRYSEDQQVGEFPTLTHSRGTITPNNARDPTRTRWSSTVKRTAHQPMLPRSGSGVASFEDEGFRSTSHGNGSLSRPSPRIRLRPPTLLPTLPTGESVNKLYMAYRSQALELGAARNAYLTKAAEAWRRGDGSGAKRFSREAHDLNTKMGLETGKAAARLVKERARLAIEAVKARDPTWSDDPGDRSARGRTCGSGLGICLGIASAGDKRLSPEERTECLLDLHGLHSGEAVEVVEDFLVALELEHFFGLAYLLIGEEKHTGTQDSARGSSRARLASGVRDWLSKWGYPWLERDGLICVDPLTHSQ